MAYAAFVNADLVTQARGAIVRTGATGQCLLAQADTLAHVANLLGTRLADVLTTASGQIGAFDEPGQLIRMDAAPAVGAVVYVSAATPGVGTTTKPAIAVPVGICYEATNVAGVDYAAVTPIVVGSTPGTLSSGTLSSSYAAGTAAADQTMVILDANGGGLVIDASDGGFTGTNALAINGTAGGTVLFPRVGGFSAASSISRAAAPGTVWDEVAFLASTITLTGGPATATALAMVHVGSGVVNGAGNTATDAYNFLVDAAHQERRLFTRPWSLGAVGNAQLQAQTAMGGATLSANNTLAILASKTIAAPIAGSVWRGLDVQASILTLAAGGTVPTTLSLAYLAAPTITSAAAYVVPTAATLTITGPPIAGNANTTILVTRSLEILGGIVYMNSDVGVYYIHDNNRSAGMGAGAGFIVGSAVAYRFSSDTTDYGVADTYLGRYGVGTLRLSGDGTTGAASLIINDSLIIGATAAGATAAKCLALSNSATAPSASVDLCHLYCADNGAGRATLAIYAEEAVAVDVGLASTHSFTVFIDGAKYKLMLVSVP